MADRTVVTAGPFTGVVATREPFDDDSAHAVDALNVYLPDTVHPSAFTARPGFNTAPYTSFGAIGQAIYCHLDLDGVAWNFMVVSGKLYRIDANLASITDVTPAGTPIDVSVRRVYFTSFIGALIVSDGVNRPWVMSNFGGTPVTKTNIDFDGAAVAWSAFGQPAVYAGSIFFILNQVGGTPRRLDIAWSIAGDPFTGYQQPDYDFAWTLQQTGQGSLTALSPSNVALFYFRDQSIGAITGVPGPDLQQTATHDAIAVNVGTLQSATIAQYGSTIFFADVNGKPWMFQPGNAPVPIWLNLRAIIETSTAQYPSAVAQVACATLIPGMDLYALAAWPPVPGVVSGPTVLQMIDAKTGNYVGQWSFGGGVAIDAVGIFNNTGGNGALAFIGNLFVGATPSPGYLWIQNTTLGGGPPLTTEDDNFITTEQGFQLTVEGTTPSWMDNDETPDIYVTTPRLGYASDTVWNADMCTVITGSDAPCAITMQTPNTAGTVVGTPTPSVSQDGTYRLVAGADIQGRGIQVKVSPQTADSQWSLNAVSMTLIPSTATAEDA